MYSRLIECATNLSAAPASRSASNFASMPLGLLQLLDQCDPIHYRVISRSPIADQCLHHLLADVDAVLFLWNACSLDSTRGPLRFARPRMRRYMEEHPTAFHPGTVVHKHQRPAPVR